MASVLNLERRWSRRLPEMHAQDDVRFSEALVEHFLGEMTAPGDVILDPFAGYGTTLEVAERMGRVAHGIELDEVRVKYARSHLQHPGRMHHADARRLADLALPRASFSLTSPPYRPRSGHPEDPLTAYRELGSTYEKYLADLRAIYVQIRELLLPSAILVLEVANLASDDGVTTLAWDIAAALSPLFEFRGEVVLAWDAPVYGYEHSYALVFHHAASSGP